MKTIFYSFLTAGTLLFGVSGCLHSNPDDWHDPNEPAPAVIRTDAPKNEDDAEFKKDFEQFSPAGDVNITQPTDLQNVQQLSPADATAPDYKDGPVLSE
ncbi:hypothetical protein [Victivallis sp. Marseille-Q1083]|uniref:hypothetical protein n=1 Tax=Victivallis sp. Marseille-Q1083 TaxID=2717288 RepID=UPI00158E25D4|nr:hypothetical protein [Victivallis sp. Marseille-Q1083]